MTTVGDEYPKEQARCRELITQYHEVGPQGAFAAAMIEGVLREADVAALSGDLPRVLAAFKAMQGCE